MLQYHATRHHALPGSDVALTGTRTVGSRVRLAVLLGLLAATLVWAWYEVRSRRARTEWQRPLEVAVALVQLGAVDPSALVALRARFPALEARLSDEYHRYGGRLPQPDQLHALRTGDGRPRAATPIRTRRCSASPSTPTSNGAGRMPWTSAATCPRAASTRAFTCWCARRATASRSLVEGSSEFGGRVGVARIELGASTVDLALFVVTHELFHTLGASDKYDDERSRR